MMIREGPFIGVPDLKNSSVYTLSKVPEDFLTNVGEYEEVSKYMDEICKKVVKTAKDSKFKPRFSESFIFRDKMLGTMVGLDYTPSFDELVKLEKVMESLHHEVSRKSVTKGHMWVLKEGSPEEYDEYTCGLYPYVTNLKPDNTKNCELFSKFYERYIPARIIKLVDKDQFRTVYFNFPLEFYNTDKLSDLTRLLNKTRLNDWPNAIESGLLACATIAKIS